VAGGVGPITGEAVAAGKCDPAARVAEGPAFDPGPAMQPPRTDARSIPIATRPACEEEARLPPTRALGDLCGTIGQLQCERLVKGDGSCVRILIERQQTEGYTSARLRHPSRLVWRRLDGTAHSWGVGERALPRGWSEQQTETGAAFGQVISREIAPLRFRQLARDGQPQARPALHP